MIERTTLILLQQSTRGIVDSYPNVAEIVVALCGLVMNLDFGHTDVTLPRRLMYDN